MADAACERIQNFYSRPCGRGDSILFPVFKSQVISTHAPAGGATLNREHEITQKGISTHAPAGGATACGRTLLGS